MKVRRVRTIARGLLLFCLLSWGLPASLAALAQQEDEEPEIKIETHVVSIPVVTRDNRNRIVTDLRDIDFRLFEDEAEVPITYYGLDKTPVDVVLLMDSSRSVREELSALQEAAFEFVRHLNPDDRVSVWSFSDRADRLCDWTPVTDPKTIAAALRSLDASGNTALYDSIRSVTNHFMGLAADALPSSRPRRIADPKLPTTGLILPTNRRCIVILTDGDDTSSRNTNLDQAITEGNRSEASVYVISRSRVIIRGLERVLDSSGVSSSDRLLARAQRDRMKASEKAMINLAERTGGRVLFPTDDSYVADSYTEIAYELHQRYSIGYTPPGDPHDGKYHSLRVECRRPNIRLWAREGYFAKSKDGK